ncbi:MAG: ATP-NAD kinase family protein [Gammaproteobacteria bacterium]|nr:ATP-NAD kinase family protein [Gammaproteobacteria bacterium]
MSLFKLGLIVNPVAGIGGRVGLKGSDGKAIREKAFELGATALAGSRTEQALACLSIVKGQFELFTVAGSMGEASAIKAGLQYTVVMQPEEQQTESSDTQKAVEMMLKENIDLLLFAGGDGTARDVYTALSELKALERISVVGIPSGCKIHSAVYAVSPVHAGELVAAIIQGKAARLAESDVMDIDEDAFRQGVVKARRYGGLWVPQDSEHMQALKEGGIEHESLQLQDIASSMIEQMQDDVLYFIGSGSTPAAIMEELGLENTLLGIDLVINQQLVASDLTEQQILSYLDQYNDQQAWLVITVIGGQGIVFGRGNQQLSPDVIRRIGPDHIMYLATAEKIRRLNGQPLRVDSGDETLNSELSGMVRIMTGYDQYMLYKISV